MRKFKPWPEKWSKCWSEPVHDPMMAISFYDEEDAEFFGDEEIDELFAIKEYYDSLVDEGRLNEDYSLNDDYSPEDEEEEEERFFYPEMGEDYWNEDSFDLDSWQFDLNYHINLIKIDPCEALSQITHIINYEFINENLLRQAFTRRAFSIEYDLAGDSEQLEFFGDEVLSAVITRELYREFAYVDTSIPSAPFRSVYQEGELTKIRSHYVSKEFLSSRAAELGLDKYILYGTGEEATESSRENMMEALIGAVAIDSNWDWDVIGDVVDRLLCVQMHKADGFLKTTYYDLFNAWHQKHFGKMPEYEIHGKYNCTLRFYVPANDKGINEYQRIDVQEYRRSDARECAAMKAYSFVTANGLWINLKEANIIPDLENSINQLQELFQKKYVEMAKYEFEEQPTGWFCDCFCNGEHGFGQGDSKTKAKKKAAYMTIVKLLNSAGIRTDKWWREVYNIEVE